MPVMEFVTKISKMGDQKKIVIIPKHYWKLIEKEGLDVEWDKELSNAERIRAELRPGKCSVKELASALDLSEAAVRMTLNQRMDDTRNLNSKAVDGSDYWGLTTRTEESA